MRICMSQNRPRFEVMSWPASELEWWSIYFSIKDNGDKPNQHKLNEKRAKSITVEQSKQEFKNLMW